MLLTTEWLSLPTDICRGKTMACWIPATWFLGLFMGINFVWHVPLYLFPFFVCLSRLIAIYNPPCRAILHVLLLPAVAPLPAMVQLNTILRSHWAPLNPRNSLHDGDLSS